MVCVNCGSNTQVTNSRLKKRLNKVWRRRECNTCKTIFTTEEVTDYGLSWAVKQSNGRIKPFLRDKLFLSLYKSCEHRKSPVEDASALTDTVIGNILKDPSSRGVIGIEQIKHASLVALNRFDKAAATHYQSFHP